MSHVFLLLGQWETGHRGVVEEVVGVVEVVGGESDDLTDLNLEESVNLNDTVEMTNRESPVHRHTLYTMYRDTVR